MHRHLIIGTILATAILGTVACGTSHEDDPTGTATSAVSATPGISGGSSETTAAALSNAEAALVSMTDVIQRANIARCPPPPPLVPNCSVLSLDPAVISTDFDRGLVAYNVKDSTGPDTTMVVAKTARGLWYPYLWGTPLHNPIQLQATVTICGFGGGAKVYASSNASSGEVGTLDDGATATAEQFVLSEPGSIANAGVKIQGYGWYRLAHPAGWAYSKYVSAGPGCELHDQLERR